LANIQRSISITSINNITLIIIGARVKSEKNKRIISSRIQIQFRLFGLRPRAVSIGFSF